ncbi:restriction endonuclease subunit S [Cellulomonas sp. CW35]|uniref:restriction endonuclease subunit S n=1 Tax=Cellulomonas sp. CW35 TaxID=3458249 RepID=UPI0040332F8F
MTVQWVPIESVLRRRLETVMVEPDERYSTFGVRNNFRGAFDAGDLLGADTKYKVLYRARAGDLVYLKLGAWERAFAMIPEELDQHVASSEFVLYEPDVQRIDPRFLSHLMAWPALLDGIGGESKGTNVRRRRLSPDVFEAARIPLPDLPTQRAIASRLDLIGGARHRVSPGSSCSRAADAILAEALSSGVERPLGDGLRRRQDAALVEESVKYSMAGVRNAGKGVFDSGVILGSQTKYRHLRPLHPGDLVYPKLGAWAGAFAVVPQDCEGRWVSPEFVTYQIDTDVLDPDFLRSLVAWDAFVDRVAGLSVGTNVNRRRLAPETLESLPVRLPSVDQQHRLGQQLAVIRQADDLLERRAHLLDSLLPAARKEEFRHLLGS